MVEAGRPSRTVRSSTASFGSSAAVLLSATCHPNMEVGSKRPTGTGGGGKCPFADVPPCS